MCLSPSIPIIVFVCVGSIVPKDTGRRKTLLNISHQVRRQFAIGLYRMSRNWMNQVWLNPGVFLQWNPDQSLFSSNPQRRKPDWNFVKRNFWLGNGHWPLINHCAGQSIGSSVGFRRNAWPVILHAQMSGKTLS